MTIKTESEFTGTTSVTKTAKCTKASAAAGSMAQLERVELEMKVETVTTTHDKTPPHKTPMVETCPFEVHIQRLTTKEIEKYTWRKSTIRPCTIKPSENIIRSSPVMTRSMAKRKLNRGQKWCTISSHPSQLPTQQKSTFKVRRHILRRHKYKTYIKCRVKTCALSYITFLTVKALNTHHHIYHSQISYKCQKCKKMIYTPSTWRFHMYCQKPKVYKCEHCDDQFMFRSKLKQHKCKHISQKLFKCFYGGCTVSYKHPQDLEWHTVVHQQIKFVQGASLCINASCRFSSRKFTCPKGVLVWGNCCERLCVEIFVRVLRSSRVNLSSVNDTNVFCCVWIESPFYLFSVAVLNSVLQKQCW